MLVTQNRQMARAVGIRSARIDMLAFGLGSGLAGLAGCALAQVREMSGLTSDKTTSSMLSLLSVVWR